MRSFATSALVALLSATQVFGQTHTDCNPLNTTCPPNMALGTTAQFNFTSNEANPAIWNSTANPVGFSTSNGADFNIKQSGDAPTLAANFYIFFGTVSVVMKAASGTGIVSSIVMLSDDLDEIDWEILGGNRTVVESNYFGKGNTTDFTRAIYHPVPFAPQDDFHNYTVTMSTDKIEWYIDGGLIRTLNYADANGGHNFPQTPMKVSVGSWAAGDVKHNSPGTVQWAQGETNFDNGPFNMYIKTIDIQDGTNGSSSYTYSDATGDWQSIKVTSGVSPIVPQLSVLVGPGAHWRALPLGTRIGIIGASIGGAVLLIAGISWFCIRSTRKGLREHAKAEAEWEAQRREAEEWRQRYRNDHRNDRLSSMNSTTKSMRI